MGAQGAPYSDVSESVVGGQGARESVLTDGYLYHVNLVVAELDTVDVILGMDFLTAYGVTINLKNDIVSLGAGALIHQITESADRIPVRLRQIAHC